MIKVKLISLRLTRLTKKNPFQIRNQNQKRKNLEIIVIIVILQPNLGIPSIVIH